MFRVSTVYLKKAKKNMPLKTPTRILQPRKLMWKVKDIPRYWFGNNPLLTHFLNVYTILVPDNEKYYIRALMAVEARIEDAGLRKELHQFCRQEALHGVAHSRFLDAIAIEKDKVGALSNAASLLLYSIMEPLQPIALKISIVAAIEHFNAIWADFFLDRQLLKRSADPEMRRLFEWHFAEEIEHKGVAFEVMQHLYPSYGLRVIGALLAAPIFYLLFLFGTAYLMAADKTLFQKATLVSSYKLLITDGFLAANAKKFLEYLRPNFHPWNQDNSHLATRIIRDIESIEAKRTVIRDSANGKSRNAA